MNTISRNKISGFTVIEMFIALAVLAILVTVALPSMENVAAKADMKAATDQVAQAFRTAKNAARLTNTSVRVTFTTNALGNNTISFGFKNNGWLDSADDEGNLQRRMTLPVIRLPARIAVNGNTVFTYDALGMVNPTPSTIELVSTANSDYASTVTIDTRMGHVVAQYEHPEDPS
jgi:prepilin-type N-terminal cleavage/methylation domain-containing protein